MAGKKSKKPERMSGMMVSGSQRNVMGPMMVDNSLRGAIMHCWMMLPEDQRSPENVEKEMMRLLKRALKDLREDASSFGFVGSDK